MFFPQLNQFSKQIEDMAAISLRCVAFAYKTDNVENIPDEENREQWVLPEDDLIFIGVAGIKVCCE